MSSVPPPAGDLQAQLEPASIWRISDIALGTLLLILGVLFLSVATDYTAGTWSRVGPRAFPSAVAVLLCVVAVALLARGALRRSPPIRRSRPLYVAIVAAIVVVLVVAVFPGVPARFPRFGPAEFTALVALDLAVAISLAHSSRTRAAGMALLGLLLGTVGVDVNSGVTRFSMGVDALSDGIGVDIVLFGAFIVGDALVCLASPRLFLRTYTRMFTAWRPARIPVPAFILMYIAAALALAGACWLAYALSHSYVDVVLILVFGILGVAAKILGWNRFLLYFGFALSALLEENIRRTLLLSRGDPSVLLQRPISGTLAVAAVIVLAIAAVLSVRRARAST